MLELFSAISENWATIFNFVTATIAVASLVANWTKTDADNKFIDTVSKLVNYLALNIKKK